MYKIQIIALGESMPKWVELGYQEYAKRLSPYLDISLCNIPLVKRTNNSNIQQILEKEGAQILKHIKPNYYTIALDIQAEQYSTEQLASQLSTWQNEHKGVQFIIGGPDGFSQEVRNQANLRLSFSKMTLPHPLVRIILIEQLYRAISILHNHPYHIGKK